MYFFVVFQSLIPVPLFVTSWAAARQASLSCTISCSLLKFLSIEAVILSNHLILWCPLLLLPSVFACIRAVLKELFLHIRWPEYWSFNISLSNKYSGLIFLWVWLVWFPCCPRDSQESPSVPWFETINSLVLNVFLWSNSHIHTWPLEEP